MSRPVPEQLRELADEVRQVRLAPAADVRARGRSRARRRTVVTTAALAVVLVAGGIGVAGALTPQPGPSAGPVPAAQPDRCAGIDLQLPGEPGAVEIKVAPGTATAATATAVAGDLVNRGFRATAVSAPEVAGPAGDAALVRYGPRAVGAATLVATLVHGPAAMVFEPGRTDTAVELTVGPAFTRLNSPTEMNQALVTVGVPTRPAQCG